MVFVVCCDLGPFLLTNLLIDYMTQTAAIADECRIINITCAAHDYRSSRSMSPSVIIHYPLYCKFGSTVIMTQSFINLIVTVGLNNLLLSVDFTNTNSALCIISFHSYRMLLVKGCDSFVLHQFLSLITVLCQYLVCDNKDRTMVKKFWDGQDQQASMEANCTIVQPNAHDKKILDGMLCHFSQSTNPTDRFQIACALCTIL